MYEKMDVKPEMHVAENQIPQIDQEAEQVVASSGDYIFELLDVLQTGTQLCAPPEDVYLTLRGIFLRNLCHEEKLGLSHEDFILFYALTMIHPELPVFVREKYTDRLAQNRIVDFKADILSDAASFLVTDSKNAVKNEVANVDDVKNYVKVEMEYSDEESEDVDWNQESFYFGEDDSKMEEFGFKEEIQENFMTDNRSPTKNKVKRPKTKQRKENQSIKCEHCDKVYTNSSNLNHHMRAFHKGITYNCELCDHKCVRKSGLKQHVDTVHSNIRIPCDQCDFQATTAAYLKEHKESKHLGIRYQCDKCPSSFNIKRNLQQHYAARHSGKRMDYQCDKCPSSFSAKRYLKKHSLAKHSGKIVEENNYLCDLCPYVTQTKKNLQKHIQIHHKIRNNAGPNVTCVECSFKAFTKSELLRHAANEHGAEVFLYEEMDSKYDDIPVAERPKSMAPKRFHCLKCPFETNFLPFLEKHTDSKHGTKVFTCEECNFETRKQVEFKAHLKYRHSAGNRLPCDQCHFTATRADALKRHIEAEHEGVRYNCELCDYTSKYKADIKKHEQHVHEGKIYNCEDCSYTCQSSNSMRAHARSHIKAKQEDCDY